jgi:hypothetical protein
MLIIIGLCIIYAHTNQYVLRITHTNGAKSELYYLVLAIIYWDYLTC